MPRRGTPLIPSSRTTDGWPNQCPICGRDCNITPSLDSLDAPCPHCGHLLWFTSNAGVLGVVTAADLSAASLQNQACINLPDDIEVPHRVLQLVPLFLADENCIFPIAVSGRALLVAAADPADIQKRDKLRFILNCEIHFVLAAEEWIQHQIRNHYPDALP